jgi:hypothetical protein
MQTKVHSSASFGRSVIASLLVATVLAMLAAPIGLRATAAQDELDIQTRVQVLHASPDLGQIEVFINNDEVLDEFTYGEQSDWIDFAPGGARVTITYDRAGFNYAAFDAVYPAPAGNDYYLIITDALVLGGVFDRTPIPDGGARVRIVQGSVALPTVNVDATGQNISFATQLAYGRSSEYTVVPAGTYDLTVNLADTGDVALTAPGVVLDGNMTYDLVIMGQPNDEDHPLEIRPLMTTTTERAESTPSTPAA